MSNQTTSGTPRVGVSAGTAFKIGFFGALGATVFSIFLSIIGAIIIAVLVLAGVSLGGLSGLWNP